MSQYNYTKELFSQKACIPENLNTLSLLFCIFGTTFLTLTISPAKNQHRSSRYKHFCNKQIIKLLTFNIYLLCVLWPLGVLKYLQQLITVVGTVNQEQDYILLSELHHASAGWQLHVILLFGSSCTSGKQHLCHKALRWTVLIYFTTKTYL